jgi:hypothetical protein
MPRDTEIKESKMMRMDRGVYIASKMGIDRGVHVAKYMDMDKGVCIQYYGHGQSGQRQYDEHG